MTRKQLNAYFDKKETNKNKAIKYIMHPFEHCELDSLQIVVKCSEKEHSEYCKNLKCSGYYNKRLNQGKLLNFYEF